MGRADHLPKPKPGERIPGSGRKPGTPNRLTLDLKELFLGALADAGGREYLLGVARSDPGVFLAGVSKFIPREIKAEIGLSIAALLRDSHSGANEPEKK